MDFIPSINLTFINGFLLIIPMFIIRFGLPYLINPESLPKLQYFPEVIGVERIALRVYFITNTFIIFSPIIFPVVFNFNTFYIGICIYSIGILFFILSIISFSQNSSFTHKGIYKLSRNPMYIGYLGIFLGTAIVINSIFHITIVIIYQAAVHFLILSEERWCKKQFGSKYEKYLEDVPRYFLLF